jgi:hypothetical protein
LAEIAEKLTPAATNMAPQWPEPPKALTLRGVFIGVAILALATVVAVASVAVRRTRLEKTTAFWGADTILCFQSGREVRIAPIDGPGATPAEEKMLALTDLPGLAHFRHALLEERHYVWPDDPSVSDESEEAEEEGNDWFYLRFSHPVEGKPATEMVISTAKGQLGLYGKTPEGQLKERVRKGVSSYLNKVYINLMRENRERSGSGMAQ